MKNMSYLLIKECLQRNCQFYYKNFIFFCTSALHKICNKISIEKKIVFFAKSFSFHKAGRAKNMVIIATNRTYSSLTIKSTTHFSKM